MNVGRKTFVASGTPFAGAAPGAIVTAAIAYGDINDRYEKRD